jgi:predicted esterase
MTAEFTHRFVAGAMATAPTILALHGTGGDENDLVPLARMIDGDAAILSPRGRVLENGMPRFFKRLAEGVFDQKDLREQTLALNEFLADAATRYHFNRDRVVALGYSNGANIAASLLLTEPNAFAGAILLRPMVPFEPTAPPPLRGIPILISASRNDPIVPPALTERLADLLKQSGASVTTLWQSSGHALSPKELEQVSEWWRKTFGTS